MVDWLGDHLTSPGFLSDEIGHERRILLDEIEAEGDVGVVTPESELYQGHPLGRSIGGSTSTLNGISMEDLRSFYCEHYSTGNIVIGVSTPCDGRVSSDECMAAIRCAFSALPVGERRVASVPIAASAGNRQLRSSCAGRDGGRIVTGYHLGPLAQARGDTAAGSRLAGLYVLSSYLSLRLRGVECRERATSSTPFVELVRYRDMQRLQFSARAHDAHDMRRFLAITEDTLASLASADPGLLDLAKSRQSGRFAAGSATELTSALQLVAWLVWQRSSPAEFVQAVESVGPAELAELAAAELRPGRRFTLSEVSIETGQSWWHVVAVLLATLLIIDWFCGFRGVELLVGAVALPLRRRGRSSRLETPKSIMDPVDTDEIERDFQRYFAEEDRTRDGR